MHADDAAAAVREYKMLTLLEPTNAKHFETAALAAAKLGDTTQARTFARRAVELNPASPVRSLLAD
jgi:Flp pilus assembly protein TadD